MGLFVESNFLPIGLLLCGKVQDYKFSWRFFGKFMPVWASFVHKNKEATIIRISPDFPLCIVTQVFFFIFWFLYSRCERSSNFLIGLHFRETNFHNWYEFRSRYSQVFYRIGVMKRFWKKIQKKKKSLKQAWWSSFLVKLQAAKRSPL